MNILLTFIGWLLWSWIGFNLTKNEADDKDIEFGLKHYALKRWDDWIGSFIAATFLLIVGHMGLGLDLIRVIDETHPPQWSDLYYAGSGVLYEAILTIYRKVKK